MRLNPLHIILILGIALNLNACSQDPFTEIADTLWEGQWEQLIKPSFEHAWSIC